MKPCNCTPGCISKTKPPLTNPSLANPPLINLRLIITTLCIKYSSLQDNELTISNCAIAVAKGVSEVKFMELKYHWLRARHQATTLRFFFFQMIKYVDQCEEAQSLLHECINQPKFREYLQFRQKHSKTIDKFLSIGLSIKDWEHIVEVKKQQFLTFKQEYTNFVEQKKKLLADSIQKDQELIRSRELKININF